MIATIVTTAGDRITVEASGNPRSPVRMTVHERSTDEGTQAEALLDEGANDVLRAALIAVSWETP